MFTGLNLLLVSIGARLLIVASPFARQLDLGPMPRTGALVRRVLCELRASVLSVCQRQWRCRTESTEARSSRTTLDQSPIADGAFAA